MDTETALLLQAELNPRDLYTWGALADYYQENGETSKTADVQTIAAVTKRVTATGPCSCFMYSCHELWDDSPDWDRYACESYRVRRRLRELVTKVVGK